MTSDSPNNDNNNLIQTTLEWIANVGINGIGGIVGGSFDGIFVNACGQTANRVFSQDQESDI